MYSKIYLLVLLSIIFLSCKSDDSEFIPDSGRGIIKIKPHRAYDFTNSIGVNTHLAFDNTNYWQKWDEIAFPRLKEIGIKHIRDGSIYIPKAEERFIDAGKAGFKLLLIATSESSESLIPKLDALLPYLSGIEAYNEADNFWDPNPEVWVPFARENQKALYNLLKSNQKYCQLPIVGLSLATLDNGKFLGDISEWLDYGNVHPYPTGFHPKNNWGHSMSWGKMSDKAEIMFNDKPLIATETGYHNYHQLGEGFAGVPEHVSAIYIPHLYFEYFNNGVARTYIYELLDALYNERGDEKECHFGLVRADGTAKPAFYALKNLISLLEDDNSNFETLPFGYEISLPTDTNNDVKHTLMQKSDGTWWIAIYRTTEIYHAASHTDIPLIPIRVTLDLNYIVRNINIYTPNKSKEQEMNFTKVNSCSFNLGAELILVEVTMN